MSTRMHAHASLLPPSKLQPTQMPAPFLHTACAASLLDLPCPASYYLACQHNKPCCGVLHTAACPTYNRPALWHAPDKACSHAPCTSMHCSVDMQAGFS
mmetsp:Transcript_35970/g.90847  ORF Transcript_35970/g.90847 Transcript_35970/m.90847 type:complete len:99 (+) Transcript_35970:337-633(+)